MPVHRPQQHGLALRRRVQQPCSERGAPWDRPPYELVRFRDDLLDEGIEASTVERLPLGPQYYPPDLYTDQAERFLAAEIVREKIFKNVTKELPYASAVTVEAWTETERRIEIDATIHVERDSQKAIVIGKGGQMLKRIGTDARLELERLLGIRVHLQLFVRVEPNWRKDPRALKKLGYEAP